MQAVPVEVADSFQWTGSNGTVQSYRHESTLQYLHVDGPTGQFYDREKNPLSREAALDRALPQEVASARRSFSGIRTGRPQSRRRPGVSHLVKGVSTNDDSLL